MSDQPRITVADAIAHTRNTRRPMTVVKRCVHCGQPPHPDTVWESGRPHKYETMALPDGVACASCVHVDRCCLLFGQLPEDRSCQWFPIRYQPNAMAAAGTQPDATTTIRIMRRSLLVLKTFLDRLEDTSDDDPLLKKLRRDIHAPLRAAIGIGLQSADEWQERSGTSGPAPETGTVDNGAI